MISAAKNMCSNNGCDLTDTRYSKIYVTNLFVFNINDLSLMLIRMGFHWPPFYTIGHLHLHAIAPAKSMSIFNRYVAFNPSLSYIFVDVNIFHWTLNTFLFSFKLTLN